MTEPSSNSSGSPRIEGAPLAPPAKQEEKVGRLPLQGSEHTVRELKEAPPTPQGRDVDVVKHLSEEALREAAPPAEKKGGAQHMSSVGTETLVEQHVEEVKGKVLNVPVQTEIARLKQDWETKEKARVDIQAQHPESAEAIMAAKKLEMDTYLKFMEGARHFRGAVLIQENGRRLFDGGYGPSDVMGTPNTTQTRFCIASLTKQFTGAAIALLMQDKSLITNPEVRAQLQLDASGQLALDTPINKLLSPEYRDNPKWKGITLEHLLRHSSGLSSVEEKQEDETRPSNFTLKELMDLAQDGDLLFNPGEMHFYSNKGYISLGAIIENLSGKSLEPFMQDHIFTPCKMGHTGMLSSYDEHTVATGFYEPSEGRLEAIPTERHLSKTYAAGSMISTVEDLGAWDRALLGNVFPTAAMKDKMFSCPTPMTQYDPMKPELYQTDEQGRAHTIEGREYPQDLYGFGLMLLKDEKNGPYFAHGGIMPGISTSMERYSLSNRCIILLTNHDDISMQSEVRDHLTEILFAGEKPTV